MATMAQIRDGLTILLRYTPAGDDGAVDAQHDEVFAGHAQATPEHLSDEDKKALDDLGWFWDGEVESWKCFT